jgi:hypothetical protein
MDRICWKLEMSRGDAFDGVGVSEEREDADGAGGAGGADC